MFEGANFQVGLTITAPLVAQVALGPADASPKVGDTHTLTATVTQNGQPLPGQDVTFSVHDGPNAGLTGHATTKTDGTATFAYSSANPGLDHVQASFVDAKQQQQTSNTVSVNWTAPPKADVHVGVDGPSFARAGQQVSFAVTVSNSGPDTATGITLRATLPAGATLVSATESRGNGCSGAACAVGTLASGAAATVTIVLTTSQTGPLGVSASAESDFDPDTSNNVASASTTVLPAAGPPPPPSQPGTFNAVDTGTVLVNGVQRPADQLFVLNSGDTVDVTNGAMTFTASDGSFGTFSSSQPTARRRTASATADNLPAAFTVDQAATGGATTLTLTGGDFSVCSSPRALSAPKQTPVRQLWGSAKGNFTSKGRYAAATVRGTIWLVQDRCDGTLTQVVDGVVAVADSTLGKTMIVTAGGTYFAAAKAPLKVSSQTAASVKKRGLVYAGHVYKTRKAFTQYLVRVGHTWGEFASAFPRLAAALAKRG
jgi:uncharacterized repeat protein (TIGR01451 family)